MKIRLYVLIAFVTIFVALNAFTPIALAEPEIFESPQILADTDENFVLRDNINGTEKAYSTLQEPLEKINGMTGNFTLYLMRDYFVPSREYTTKQKGNYTLNIRSAGSTAFTIKNIYHRHFDIVDPNLDNRIIINFENIILDGGQEEYHPKPGYYITIGGIDLGYNCEVTLGKGFVLKNCSDLGTGQVSPIYMDGKKATLIIKDGAKFIHNITRQRPRLGLIKSYGGTLKIDDAEFIDNSCGTMGGIIDCDDAGNVSIKNSKFENNICDGRGVINIGCDNLDIINCVFTGNQVSDFYSGTINIGGCNARINDCKFYNNFGPDGGAIYVHNSSASIKGWLFKGNYSTYRYGGAIYLSYESTLDLSDSDFLDNGKYKRTYDWWEPEKTYYTDKGGAIGIDGNCSAKIKNCKFISNSAYDGGAIFTELYTRKPDSNDYTEIQDGNAYSNLTIDSDCVFKDNYSEHGYFAPPLNFSDLNNLKFKSNSFTGKGYPYVLSLDKSLLNNYDVNYDFGAYIYTFDSNKGIFLDNTGSFHTDDSRYFTVRVNKGREYKISDVLPTFNKMIFVGWEDEEGVVHKAGEILPPADSNRVFKAVWEPYSGLIPQTGDTSNILLYSVLLAIATMTSVFITLKNKRKTN